MKSPESGCDEQQLLAMLQDELNEQQTKAVVDHIASCLKCQLRCEELAASPAEWRLVSDVLRTPPDRPGSRPTSVDFETSAPQPSWNESMAEQLLSPPVQPEMLGRLGRYEVEKIIGVGGMGVVFKAQDSELGRPAAIKVLAPFLAGNATAVQRFAREARAAAAVVHQHVVPIYNVETNRQSPFLVMHFVAGESLQARIDRVGSLDLAEILRIGMQVASGLAAAHHQGLVHRDIKPSNILLEDAGVERALITDFGLAQAADDVQMTRTGVFMGTPQYMSPEQARGETVDHRSDLFSLGSVLYTMCTGRPAFRAASTLATMRRITDEEPTPIRQLNPLIPDWMSSVIEKLLAKDKQVRIQSAEQLSELLAGCLAHVQQPSSVPLPSEAARLSEIGWQRKFPNRAKIGIASLVLICAISSVVGFLAYKKNSTRVNSTATDAEKKSSVLVYDLGHGYSRAGEKILHKNAPIEDLESYGEDFARTKESTFKLAERVDAASFFALNETYTKDQNKVYLKLAKSGRDWFVTLPEADTRTFRVVSGKLAADSKNVWWYGQRIPDVDPASLKVVHEGFVWKDAGSVWFRNHQIKDADAVSFEYLTQSYYRDANRVYWTSVPIADAEPLTFRVFGNELPYGADRDSVWHRSSKLVGVDSSSFDAIHPYIYKDKNRAYVDGRPVSKVNPDRFRLLARLDDQLTALLTDGTNYFVYLSPIEGLYQIESNGEFLILTQEIWQAVGDERKKIDDVRVVLDQDGHSREPVSEKHKGKIDLMLSMHRKQLLKAGSIMVSRKTTYSFESIGVPGNIAAISDDQKTVILLNHPAIDRPIFGSPKLWDLERQQVHSVLPESNGWSWSFVPQRTFCVAASLKEGRIRLWDYSKQAWFGDWISAMPSEDLGANQIFAFSPDGNVLATAQPAGNLQVWDLMQSVPVLVNEGPDNEQQKSGEVLKLPQSLTFSKDGQYVFMNSSGELKVWDSATGKCVAGPFEHALDDNVHLSTSGQLASISHRRDLDGDTSTITIRAASKDWGLVRSFDLPGKVSSAKWLGDQFLLITRSSSLGSQIEQDRNASTFSASSAYVIPVDADKPSDGKPIREVAATAVVSDGNQWIGINRNSVFCMSPDSSKPVWETKLEFTHPNDSEEVQCKVLFVDQSWIAIEQRAKSGGLVVLDLKTGIEVLKTRRFVKAFVVDGCIAESYHVHRDNIRTSENDFKGKR